MREENEKREEEKGRRREEKKKTFCVFIKNNFWSECFMNVEELGEGKRDHFETFCFVNNQTSTFSHNWIIKVCPVFWIGELK